MKKMFNLKNLILLTIFLLPVYLIKLNFLGIPSNVLEILIGLVLVGWIFKKNKKITPILRENKAVFISSGIVFFGLVVSTFLNPNFKAGLGIFKGWFSLPFLLAFTAQNIFQGEKRKQIFEAYFYSVFAVALVSLAYFFFGELTFDERLKAFFNSPNYLIMYLAPGFIWGIFNINKDNLKYKTLFGIQLVIIAAVIYLTKSYAGWLAISISVIIAGFFMYGKKMKISLALIAIILLAVIFQFQTEKFSDLIRFNERSSLASRIMIWQSTGKIIGDNWLWGIGPGNFQNKYLEYQKYFPPYLEWAVPHPHNLYLSFWLSGGILGFLGFLALIFFWMKNFWRKEDRKKYIGIFAILLYILIHGLFDTTYFKNDLAVVFWLVILTGV